MEKIDKLIINSPYEEPKVYWSYERTTRTFSKTEGRRPAGYVMATPGSQAFDDPGVFVEIPLVNNIRKRIQKWRENGYPGVTGITKRLLEHWYNLEERQYRRFFFCQLESIETLIWLFEAPDSEKVGIDIPSDGGEFRRICSKMATGSGKTIVMSMLIAWQVLNKATYAKDTRFSKNILVIAPGLTVKNRLQVLIPDSPGNYYDEFNIIPVGLIEKLREGKVFIHNWHVLNWDTEEKLKKKRSVDKRGVKSDEAYVREVLGDMASSQNVVVINDEAHHAWRVNIAAEGKYIRQRDLKDSAEEATVWVGGLDRINKARGILSCFDFSATPFAPSGKRTEEEALFGWIVSDFGLNDSIESGLVKTPRVVIRDDGRINVKDYKSRLYHIYMDEEVKEDINRKAEASVPLPDLILNAYYLLGKDWLETKEKWDEVGKEVPPVMITVANRTETAARIKFAFDHKEILIPELCDPEKTLQIDSKVLAEAESQVEEQEIVASEGEDTEHKKLNKQQQAELLRKMVDTVGQKGQPGEKIQKVISVGMLSEGWDAKTVTHIMGLRAFSSQLLCEQVVGRGLRRTSYEVGSDGLFEPEYVNIFGVPFAFLPHEGGDDNPPPPPKPKTQIEPVKEKEQFALSWPNVIRVDHVYRLSLVIDFDKLKPIELDPYESITSAEMAAILEGKPNRAGELSEIDLKEIAERYRMQTIIFETAKRIYNNEKEKWQGMKEHLFGQLVGIVTQFVDKDKIVIKNDLFRNEELRKRVLILLNMNKIIHYVWQAIKLENTTDIKPIFDTVKPIRSTGDMRTWYTSKPCEYSDKSHVNFCVYDSTWEATESYILDKNKYVSAWVKNDHLGFEVMYNYQGVVRKYWPDFIIKLVNGTRMILETKGKDDERNKIKRDFLDEWVRAVNTHGGFGKWAWAVSRHPSDLEGILRSGN
ncbi:MAG: DEAD/DEAH box helicase family protein [Candidatus Omnitrophica bacterium]|nr:DEAD/DEAH box helicase family protein [Candidatus Omnitrophota bacterium]MBU4477749.1 DEAD/DEAH box helicase family protein [Candidatus Omnitrophota bacterium]MCG2703041.1 DEAD/DEAH box helicase family protein [Candidatus Omnitrophota bacterium]